MQRRRALVPLLALACLTACKGDDGIDSGLPASKPADELPPDEQTQLCEATQDYVNERIGPEALHRFECTIEGVGESLAGDQSVATCAKARDACIAMPDPDADPVDPNATCELGVDWTTCKASVSELEACFTEYADQGAAAFSSYSCDKMAEYAKMLPTYDPSLLEPGPACQDAQAKCPGLFGSGTDAMTG